MKEKFTNKLSAKITVMFLDVLERKPAIVVGGLLSFSVLMPLGMAFAGLENTGKNLYNLAYKILQPVGLLYGGWHTYQAFSSDHDKGKHVMKAVGGFLIATLDNTVKTLQGLIG